MKRQRLNRNTYLRFLRLREKYQIRHHCLADEANYKAARDMGWESEPDALIGFVVKQSIRRVITWYAEMMSVYRRLGGAA